MSRPSTAQPEFRLYFGYPSIIIECDAAPGRRIPLDRGDPLVALRGVSTEIRRRRGRLTAFLPEGEVWYGRTMDTKAVSARRTAAAHLDVPPASVTLTLGPIGPDGARSVAAVRCSTIREARDFLARANLRPAQITVSGTHDGFTDAPVFRISGMPSRIMRTAVVSSGLAASLLVIMWAAASPPSAPEAAATLVEPVASLTKLPVVALASATMPPSVALFSPSIAYTTPPPLARPVNLPGIAAASAAPDQPPAPVRTPVVLASRSMPEGLRAVMPPAIAQGVKIASLEGPRARPVLAAATVQDVRPASTEDLLKPQPRPGAPALAAAAPAPVQTATRPVGNGPLARPGGIASAGAPVDVFVATLSAAIAAPASAATPAAARSELRAGVRPAPRPATTPVRVASLSPAVIATPAAALNALVAAPPEPRRITPARAATATAAPKAAVVQTKPAAPAQPARVQTVSVPAQAAPASTQRVVVVPAPQPTRTAAVVSVAPAPTATPQRSTAQPKAAQKPPATTGQPQQSLGRNSIALIGVFGTAAGRHALIQLPNGQTQRVRQGDEIQGVRVTAVDSDSVHLRAQGRDTVIRLPQ